MFHFFANLKISLYFMDNFRYVFSDQMSESGGAGAGVLVGAGVGGAVLVVVIIAVVIYCYMKARKEKSNTNMTKSNDIFHTGKRNIFRFSIAIPS